MAHIQIALLGAFDVTLDGEPVTAFGYDKVRALLAFLAVEADRPHRRAFLAGLLWPDYPETNALRSLSQALYRLRAVLHATKAGPSFLAVTSTTVHFAPSPDWWLDVQAFTASLAPCQDPAHAGLDRCAPCRERWQQAVALYRGEFLQGFSLPDSEPFDEWLVLQQECFHTLAVTALHDLAACYERRRELALSLHYARRWLEIDPWHEDAHRQVMRLLAQTGDRAGALAHCTTCRRVLLEGLGVEPDPTTVRLCAAIRAGVDLSAALPVIPHNLPAALTPLTGRKAELAAITQTLQDPECRLLSLVGPGGCGKTRLALEVAATQLEYYPNGVYFVSLTAVPTVDGIVPALVQALGFTVDKQADPQCQLLAYLRAKQMLLIFDNFEHLLPGLDLVLAILRAAPAVKVILTSRIRANTQAEHLFLIGGMTYPEEASVLPGTPSEGYDVQYDAIELFFHVAHRIRSDLALTPGDMAAVAHICRAVDGMPLALLLAASWLTFLSPADIAVYLDNHSPAGSAGLDLLATDWRDLPERHRSMRTVFEQSWQLLTPAERTILAALSVFRGGFARAAAQTVTGASVHQLRKLADSCLVQTLPNGRYQMHELLRQFAAEKLAQSPASRAQAEHLHATYFSAALSQWTDDLLGRRQQAALAEMEADIGNVGAAWEWFALHKALDYLGHGIDGLCRFYAWRSRYQEGMRACDLVVHAIADDPSPEAQRLLARLLIWRAVFAATIGNVSEALSGLQRTQTCLDALATQGVDINAEKAFLLRELGALHAESDRVYAQRCWHESLRLYQFVHNRWGEAKVLNDLGWLAWQIADYPAAKALLEASLSLLRLLGERKGMAESLRSLGAVATLSGSPADAEITMREAASISRALGDRNDLAVSLYNLGSMLVFTGRFEEGLPALYEASAHFEELGTKNSTMMVDDSLLWGELHLGYYARLHQRIDEEFSNPAGLPNPHMMAVITGALGAAALAEANYPAAQQYLTTCVERMTELHQNDQACMAKAEQARTNYLMGNCAEAHLQVQEALHMAGHGHGYMAVLHTLGAVADLYLTAGRPEQAVALYATMCTHPYVANSRWWHDILGQRIDAAAAQLPPAIAAAARQHGAQQDLHDTIVAASSAIVRLPQSQ